MNLLNIIHIIYLIYQGYADAVILKTLSTSAYRDNDFSKPHPHSYVRIVNSR